MLRWKIIIRVSVVLSVVAALAAHYQYFECALFLSLICFIHLAEAICMTNVEIQKKLGVPSSEGKSKSKVETTHPQS